MPMGAHVCQRSVTALLIMFFSCTLSQAQSQRTMHLELPSLDGAAFIRLDQFAGKPMVLNFWSSDCPPCIAEMPMLFKEALRYPQTQFLGIAVESRLSATHFLDGQKVTYPQVVALPTTEGIMRRFGNPKGALPYTVVLSKSHQLCQVKTGMVDAAWIQAAVAKCST
jgi:thiol-disulfide isomerase/thioredoxin